MIELIAAVFVLWLLIRSRNADSGAMYQQAPPGTGSNVDDYNALDAFTAAWAHAEGNDVTGSLAQRTNNPVNIHGEWVGETGHTSSGQTIFDSSESGYGAAETWIQQQAQQHPGWSLKQFFGKVLGNLQGQSVDDAQGNSDQEASTVADELDIDPSTDLAAYLGLGG